MNVLWRYTAYNKISHPQYNYHSFLSNARRRQFSHPTPSQPIEPSSFLHCFFVRTRGLEASTLRELSRNLLGSVTMAQNIYNKTKKEQLIHGKKALNLLHLYANTVSS